MYTPAAFKEENLERLERFIDEHPLATLVTIDNGLPVIDHLPCVRDGRLGIGSRIISHVAKANRIWSLLEHHPAATLVFSGASAYVSPSFYPSKSTTHEVVPTWNYAAIHLRGVIQCTHDALQKRDIVDRLTSRMEAGRPQPWSLSDAPAAYIEKMIDGFVGLNFVIERIDGKIKASQNRNEVDRSGVFIGLNADPLTREAASMIPTP